MPKPKKGERKKKISGGEFVFSHTATFLSVSFPARLFGRGPRVRTAAAAYRSVTWAVSWIGSSLQKNTVQRIYILARIWLICLPSPPFFPLHTSLSLGLWIPPPPLFFAATWCCSLDYLYLLVCMEIPRLTKNKRERREGTAPAAYSSFSWAAP